MEELLLDAKAEINHQSKTGATALHFACKNSNVEVARLLLERGANQKLRGLHSPGPGEHHVPVHPQS